MSRLIDGDALIAWIKGSQQMTSKMKSIICYIKTMPTVEAIPSARPNGEWIDRGMRVPSSWVKKCSLCGHETDTWRWCKFCPNCGADMRERKEKCNE